MPREEIQRRISDLQVLRWRIRNSTDLSLIEKEDAIWWINGQIAESFEELNSLCYKQIA